MADNTEVASGTGVKVASDKVSYSGDADQNVQLVRVVGVTGAEGSKTVIDMAVSTAFADGESNTQNVVPVEAYNVVYNGSTWDRLRGDTTNGMWVNVKTSASHAVTNAGTFATQVDGNALTALQLIDDPVYADDAAFTIATGKVMVAGAAIVAHGTAPDAADAGDAGALLANRNRVLFTIGGNPNIQSSEYYTTTAATDDNIMPAIGAGTIYVITQISVTVSAACTVSPSVRIGFGATTVPAQGASQADATAKVILSHPGIPAGSGVVKGSGAGIVGIGGDGEELRITCSAPTTGSLIVQVDWYSIAS